MSAPRITSLSAIEILDSRGNPTLEVRVGLSNGETASASVPSGASTGQFESWELRDADAQRYNGKGVLHACRNVHDEIFPKLRGMRITQQSEIDERMIELDGTPNKARLGANALLGVSLACARAAAAASSEPLYRYLRAAFDLPGDEFRVPRPMLNILNGGRHADNGLDFQEYMIMPQAATFADQLRMGVEIVTALAEVLHMKNLPTLVGDEGGFAPRCSSNREPLQLIAEAVDRTRYKLGTDIRCALDVAASEFYRPDDRTYFLKQEQRNLSTDELLAYYAELAEQFPIASLEDGCADIDEEGWIRITAMLKDRMLLVGDDVFVTNTDRLAAGVAKGMGNAIIIKPNQIGTLSETIETVRRATAAAYTPIVSHRSGETTDSFIADLAVAVNAPLIKAGSVQRGERSAKYNRLLAIEQELA